MAVTSLYAFATLAAMWLCRCACAGIYWKRMLQRVVAISRTVPALTFQIVRQSEALMRCYALTKLTF